MTNKDLQYLKRATPEELMKLTNGIPGEICLLIKAHLSQSKPLTIEQRPAIDATEIQAWDAAGAVCSTADTDRWLDAHLSVQQPCDECGNIKYPYPKPGLRLTFTRDHGFGLHNLCGQCCQDFDCHYYPLKLAELATRWQGRCLARREVGQ
jgi:hypothetical protein